MTANHALANGGIALLFQSPRLVAAVAELGWFGIEALGIEALEKYL